ncbi:MAG: hypothetical protein OHK0024_09510 [Thalassobaculales bacterium]
MVAEFFRNLARLPPEMPMGTALSLSDAGQFRQATAALLDSHPADAPIAAAGLRLIGLGRRLAEFGSGIGGFLYRLGRVVEGRLGRALTPADLFARVAEGRWVVLYGRLSPGESVLAADRLAAQLTRDLADRPETLDLVCRSEPFIVEQGALKQVDPARFPGLVEAAQAAALARARQLLDGAHGPMRLAWWPVLRVSSRMVPLYAAEMAGGHGGPLTPGEEAEIDGRVLAAAGEALALPIRRGRPLLMARVHYASLAEPEWRLPLRRVLDGLDDAAARRLVLEIHGLPARPPAALLGGLGGLIGRPLRGLVLRCPLGAAAMGAGAMGLAAAPGILGVSVDGAGQARPDRATFEALAASAQALHRQGLKALFRHASSLDMARSAKLAQFDYLDGTSVAPSASRPGRVMFLR